MKKITYLLSVFFIMAGCSDFLQKEPLTTLSPQSFWKTESDLTMALNVLYNKMNTDYSIDNQSADCFANAGDPVSSGTYTPPNTDNEWTNSYNNIRIANDFLENYKRAPLTETVLNRYAGEASFFRAYYYYNLVTRFGDVPLITKTLDMQSPELYGARTPKAEVWAQIMKDLDFASANIPVKSKMKADLGRITKGAAQSFLARAALYAGTYYKYHGGGDPLPFLQKAKEAAKAVIDSKEYKIFADYRNLFLAPGEDSDEHILSFRFAEEIGRMNDKTRKIIYDIDCEPTKYMADNFLCKDGLPVEKSIYKTDYLPLGKEFENRDPRMALTLWKPGDSFSGAPFVPNLANQTRTGYMFKKYGSEDAFTYVPAAIYIDNILIRYAEVLLIYAETSFELNGSISDDDLDLTINTLRNRFASHPDKLPRLTNSFVTDNGLNMLEEIRRERRAELAGEALRYSDIVRWKIADKELNRSILGAKFDASAYPKIKPGKDIFLDENGFIIVQNKTSRNFDPAKNYLFPIPLREISLNQKLKQNPGW